LRKYISFLLLEESRNRELALLPAIRGAQMRSLSELNSLLELINWDKKKLNLYIICAKLKAIPNFTFNMNKRSQEETHPWFLDKENGFESQVYESDIFFDFDADDINEVLSDVKKVKEFFDNYEVPYQIIASGNKGMHLIIDGKYAPIKEVREGVVFPHKTFIENVKEALNLSSCDLSNVHLINRLRKLPFSLVLPKRFKECPEMCSEQIMNVALPLSDEMFNNFKPQDLILCNVLKKVKLIRMGNLERFPNLSLEQKKLNVQKILKEFDAL